MFKTQAHQNKTKKNVFGVQTQGFILNLEFFTKLTINGRGRTRSMNLPILLFHLGNDNPQVSEFYEGSNNFLYLCGWGQRPNNTLARKIKNSKSTPKCNLSIGFSRLNIKLKEPTKFLADLEGINVVYLSKNCVFRSYLRTHSPYDEQVLCRDLQKQFLGSLFLCVHFQIPNFHSCRVINKSGSKFS